MSHRPFSFVPTPVGSLTQSPPPSPIPRARSAPDLDNDHLAFAEKNVLATDSQRPFSAEYPAELPSSGSANNSPRKPSPKKQSLVKEVMVRTAVQRVVERVPVYADGLDDDWRIIWSTKPLRVPDAMSSVERRHEGWIDVQAIRPLLPIPKTGRAKLLMSRNGSERLETLEVANDMDHLMSSLDVGRRGKDIWCYSLRRGGSVRVWYRDLNGMVAIIISAPDEKGCVDFRAPKELQRDGFAPFLRILADRINALSSLGFEG